MQRPPLSPSAWTKLRRAVIDGQGARLDGEVPPVEGAVRLVPTVVQAPPGGNQGFGLMVV
jgi:hypothetical protein